MAGNGKNLKVLMIGNSFSISVGVFLPKIVNVNPEHSLELTNAYIGGCVLERHYNNLLEAEKNPDADLYQINFWAPGETADYGVSRRGNVNELLKNNQYDIISIQQGSVHSWRPECCEPYAGEIIKYIRQYQKNAEIIIQQTWAYRSDSPHFAEFGIGQYEMYEKARDAYKELAERYQLRMIPTGDAVELFRARTPVKYQAPVRQVKYPEEAPGTAGDVVGCSFWQKDENGEYKLVTDTIHLNDAGQFMQAALWFAFLFDEPALKAAPAFPDISENNDADLILQCVQDALDGSKK